MKQMLFVFNPRSGKEQIRGSLLRILDIFTKDGYDIHVHVTQSQGDASRIVKELGEGMDLILCSGGDGTLNETICGMLALKDQPPLGYIPAGSTNDFAVSLQIPKDMERAALNVVNGAPFAVDVGSFCGDRNFVYIAGFGAFTEVAYATSQDRKNLLGHPAYMLEALKSISSIKPYHMLVQWEEGELEEDFVFGMVTNTRSVGGFKNLVNQTVALNDGAFEVLLIRMPKTPGDLSNIISHLFLQEEPNEYVYRFKTASICFQSAAPVDWVLDGEYGGARTQAQIGCLREKIRILVDRC